MDFKKRITKDFLKHNAFRDSYLDVIEKTEELFLRLKDDNHNEKTKYIFCLLISNKFVLDDPIDNLSFSKLFFIDLKKMKNLEIYFLSKLDWKL